MLGAVISLEVFIHMGSHVTLSVKDDYNFGNRCTDFSHVQGSWGAGGPAGPAGYPGEPGLVVSTALLM